MDYLIEMVFLLFFHSVFLDLHCFLPHLGILWLLFQPNNDIHILLNHDWDRDLGSTKQGNLELEEDNVVKTSPIAGTKRKKGSEIKIYVSTGDATIAIEDYTGKNYLEIKGALEARGLVVNIEEEAVEQDSEFKEDEIARQSVEAGESLKAGESITLYVAKKGEAYPDFTDGSYNRNDVEEFCEEYSLKCDYVETESETNLAGTIYKQSREAGSPIKSGASFKIYIYKAPSNDTEISDGQTCDDGLC